MGIAQSPEGRKCFQRMTVRENLELGAYLRRDSQGIEKDLKRIFELFPRLDERQSQKAGTMSGGEQQMLAIGRALMADPKVLLLDEPSMGISPVLTERIYETIAEINQEGMTILLVEQNANFALDVSKRAYVLETGKVVDDGQLRHAADQPRRAEGVPRNMIDSLYSAGSPTARWNLLWMYVWLVSAIAASYLSERKGYSDRAGSGHRPVPDLRRVRSSGWSCRPSRTRSGSSSARSGRHRQRDERFGSAERV